MQSLAILLICVLAATSYGIAHNHIAARVCAEYGHLFVDPTNDPNFDLGILSSLPYGFFLGIPLAVVARAGSLPGRVRPVRWSRRSHIFSRQ